MLDDYSLREAEDIAQVSSVGRLRISMEKVRLLGLTTCHCCLTGYSHVLAGEGGEDWSIRSADRGSPTAWS